MLKPNLALPCSKRRGDSNLRATSFRIISPVNPCAPCGCSFSVPDRSLHSTTYRYVFVQGSSSHPPARCYDFPVSRHSRGIFITFEGLDGCGKSTQLEKLAATLRAQKLPVVVTREPGGTPIAEKIRNLLLDTHTGSLAPLAELAMMFAARAQHIQEVIEPALTEGKIVLCDRFTDSTEAYQGGGRKLGSQPVLALHPILCGDLHPDLTLLMDSDVAISVERARRRNRDLASKTSKDQSDENRFEKENRAFFGRVRHAYLAIAEREPQRIAVIDARGTPEQTHRQIMEVVRSRVKLAAKTA
jgi:dTMP kinase